MIPKSAIVDKSNETFNDDNVNIEDTFYDEIETPNDTR